MAKGGRRPTNRKKPFRKENKQETKNIQRTKDQRKQDRKSKTLLRQMRGMKWDEDEYIDEIDELDDMVE